MKGSVTALGQTMRWSYGVGLVLYLAQVARLELNYVVPMGVQKGDKYEGVSLYKFCVCHIIFYVLKTD